MFILEQMAPEEVERIFYSPENTLGKDVGLMPDFQAVYNRLTAPGSKANLFYLWLKYKQKCPSGYQYTQFCAHFKRFVEKNYGSDAVSIVVEQIPGEKSTSTGLEISRSFLQVLFMHWNTMERFRSIWCLIISKFIQLKKHLVIIISAIHCKVALPKSAVPCVIASKVMIFANL